MGKTKSIIDCEAENTGLTNYLNQCTKNLKASAKDDMDRFLAGTIDFYKKNGWDALTLSQKESYDYKQVDEFSLDNVSRVIKQTVKGIFGGDLSEGTPLEKGEAVVQAVASVASYEALALSAAMSLVQHALAVFSTNTSLAYSSSIARQPIAPGVTVHLFMMTAGFNASNFTNVTSIVEDAFYYQLVYSSKEQQLFSDVKAFEELLDGFTKLIKKMEDTILTLQDQYDALLLDPDTSELKLDTAEKRISRLRQSIDTCILDIDKKRKEIFENAA